MADASSHVISPRSQRLVLERRLWIAAYVFAWLMPIAILAFAPRPVDDRVQLFALAIGFIAFAGMALQVAVASRSPHFTAPMGIDLLLRVHRSMGSVIMVLVVLHVAVLYVREDWARAWLWPPPVHGPIVAQLGFLALVSLLVLVATSLRRPRWMSYERWRAVHLICTVAAIGGAYGHILKASTYSTLPIVRVYAFLLVLVAGTMLVYLRIGRVFIAQGRPYHLVGIEREHGNVTTVHLEADGHDGIPLAPGQFAWLRLGGHPYSINEHPFSLSSSAVDPRHPSFSIKASGDYTSTIGALPVGSRVLVDGPHGAWEPALPDRGFLLIVGGIGVTPAMSIIRTLADMGDSRPIDLIYGARTWNDVTFRDELAELAERISLRITYVLSEPDAGWAGNAGYITHELLAHTLPEDAAVRNVMVCGPPMMMKSVTEALRSLAIPDAHVRVERFEGV